MEKNKCIKVIIISPLAQNSLLKKSSKKYSNGFKKLSKIMPYFLIPLSLQGEVSAVMGGLSPKLHLSLGPL